MRAKNVNQSSDFPVRRTGSYRHKKALSVLRSKGVSLRTTLQRHAAIRPIIDKHDIIRTEPEVGYITYRNAARGGPIVWP